jgi:DNA-binding transcriptional LysR family regulator
MAGMNWNDFRFVLAVAQARSFQGAGRLMRVSHTTVSRRIAALEHALGQPLFLRQHKTCLPTADCARLVAAAQRIEDEVLMARRQTSIPGLRQTERVHVVSVNWIVSQVLLPAVPALRAANPDLLLRLDGTLADEPPRTTDPVISLRFELNPDRGETAVPVARIAYSVYAPAGCDAPDRLPWVSFHGSAPLDWLMARGVSPAEVMLMLSDGAAVRDAVRQGIGRGLMPDCLAAGQPGLQRLSGPTPEFSRLLRAVGAWDDLLSPACQSVVAWVEASFKAMGCGVR